MWLGEIVKYHMQRLRLLNLDGAPAGVVMGEVTRVWAETIAACHVNANEHIDGPRLHEAFLYLMQTSERWPAPKHLLKAIPPRPQPQALPAPTIAPEKRAQILAQLADLRASFDKTPQGARRKGNHEISQT